ncbi:hypothetical protein FPL03_16865 [Xanthomonas citri pv. glycines]|nr:hypothetical protein BHE84_24380 [Xanthomonas citri pv. glycines str. 8ra]QDR46264.1 hypothetical protein FPK90_17625 [Xanthomonas citri pv. glycines]QDS08256.1 hypothetical protein FPL00_16520 [Xanthomonas citri pv. glycines]QDS12601.1 hypothetical protein FPL03_16865 [Xanthomonas citri pv. glycines]QDS21255.1 hypothetical protein FPL05_17240 [Xanthomonas citri pv. glycines]
MVATPWWFTVICILLTGLITDRLSRMREASARKTADVKRWREDLTEELHEWCAAASEHYTSQDSIKNTEKSAALLVAGYRRIRRNAGKFPTINIADGAKCRRLMTDLDELVTGDPDFENQNRALRPARDPLLTEMHNLAEKIENTFNFPRKEKS